MQVQLERKGHAEFALVLTDTFGSGRELLHRMALLMRANFISKEEFRHGKIDHY